MAGDTGAASAGDVLGTAAPTVTWRGQAYKLGRPDQAAKERFELLVWEAEKAALRAEKEAGLATADEYAAARRALGAAFDRREYRQGGDLWRKYVMGGAEAEAGVVLFVLSLLQAHHPDLRYADVRAMGDEAGDDMLLALQYAVPPFFGWAGEAMRLPPQAMEAVLATAMAPIRARLSSSTPAASTAS